MGIKLLLYVILELSLQSCLCRNWNSVTIASINLTPPLESNSTDNEKEMFDLDTETAILVTGTATNVSITLNLEYDIYFSKLQLLGILDGTNLNGELTFDNPDSSSLTFHTKGAKEVGDSRYTLLEVPSSDHWKTSQITITLQLSSIVIAEITVLAMGCTVPDKLKPFVVAYSGSNLQVANGIIQPWIVNGSYIIAHCSKANHAKKYEAYRCTSVNTFRHYSCTNGATKGNFPKVYVVGLQEVSNYRVSSQSCLNAGGSPAKISSYKVQRNILWVLNLRRNLTYAMFGLRSKKSEAEAPDYPNLVYHDGSKLDDSDYSTFLETSGSGRNFKEETVCTVVFNFDSRGKWNMTDCRVEKFRSYMDRCVFVCEFDTFSTGVDIDTALSNPIKYLHQWYSSDIQIKFKKESSGPQKTTYNSTITVPGLSFTGHGPRKIEAMEEAARKALRHLMNN